MIVRVGLELADPVPVGGLRGEERRLGPLDGGVDAGDHDGRTGSCAGSGAHRRRTSPDTSTGPRACRTRDVENGRADGVGESLADGAPRSRLARLLLAAPCCSGPTSSPSSPSFCAGGDRDLGWRRAAGLARPGASPWPSWPSTPRRGSGIPFGLYHYTGATAGRELYLSQRAVLRLRCPFRSWPTPPSASRAGRSGRSAAAWVAAARPGSLMMLLDVVIDPLAVRGDRWFLGRIFYYAEPGVYFGVPAVELRGLAARRLGHRRRLPSAATADGASAAGSPGPGHRPLLRRARCSTSPMTLVDRGVGAPGGGNPDPCRGLSATL